MRFQFLAPLLVASAASAYNSASDSGFTPASTTSTDFLAANGLLNLAINQIQKCFPGQTTTKLYLGQCGSEERMVSVEPPHPSPFTDDPRSTLSTSQRKAYTDAVLCLRSKPPLTNQTIVPGAKTRYGELASSPKKYHANRNRDDFVWTHINQTLTIHGTVSCSVIFGGNH